MGWIRPMALMEAGNQRFNTKIHTNESKGAKQSRQRTSSIPKLIPTDDPIASNPMSS
jgi:hypothetical protein